MDYIYSHYYYICLFICISFVSSLVSLFLSSFNRLLPISLSLYLYSYISSLFYKPYLPLSVTLCDSLS